MADLAVMSVLVAALVFSIFAPTFQNGVNPLRAIGLAMVYVRNAWSALMGHLLLRLRIKENP